MVNALDLTRGHKFEVKKEQQRLHDDIMMEKKLMGFTIKSNENINTKLIRIEGDIEYADSQAVPANRTMILKRIYAEANEVELSIKRLISSGVASKEEIKVIFNDELAALERIKAKVKRGLGGKSPIFVWPAKK